MASITERDGRFLVRVRRQGDATVTKTFTRKSDGLAWARRVEADMESDRWKAQAIRAPSLRECVQEYRKTVAPKLKWASAYRYRFDEFETLPFASSPVNEVQPADLAHWRDLQLKYVKPSTVTRKLAMLRSTFTWAMKERGWVTVNPLAAVRKPSCADGWIPHGRGRDDQGVLVARRQPP